MEQVHYVCFEDVSKLFEEFHSKVIQSKSLVIPQHIETGMNLSFIKRINKQSGALVADFSLIKIVNHPSILFRVCVCIFKVIGESLFNINIGIERKSTFLISAMKLIFFELGTICERKQSFHHHLAATGFYKSVSIKS